jgi:hypothetical protein
MIVTSYMAVARPRQTVPQCTPKQEKGGLDKWDGDRYIVVDPEAKVKRNMRLSKEFFPAAGLRPEASGENLEG